MSLARKGRPHSQEAVEKQRLSMLAHFQKHPRVGILHSQASKDKLSRTLKGKPFTEKHKAAMRAHMLAFLQTPRGKLHADMLRQRRLGCKATPEVRAQMSLNRRGEKNANYVHGMARFPYPVDFSVWLKRKIRKRDGHACRLCGMPENGYDLHAHHIDYDKHNNDEANLISLCVSCHTKTNYNRPFWRVLLPSLQARFGIARANERLRPEPLIRIGLLK
jgi:hypothetical protein